MGRTKGQYCYICRRPTPCPRLAKCRTLKGVEYQEAYQAGYYERHLKKSPQKEWNIQADANRLRKLAADANYERAKAVLAEYSRKTNGGRKYLTPEDFMESRKRYVWAHAVVRQRNKKTWIQAQPKSWKRRKVRDSLVKGASQEVVQFYKDLMKDPLVPCAWCGREINRGERTIDHMVPLSKGGKHEIGNLAIACVGCNSRKQDLMPEMFRKLLDSRSGSC